MSKTTTQKKAAPARRPSPRGEPAVERQTKKQIAFGRKQARQNRIILISVIALAVVIVGIVLAGVLNEVVLKPRQPVAIVNGARIRQDEYQALVTYRRTNLQNMLDNYQAELDKLDPNDTNNQFLISFYQQYVAQLQQQLADVGNTALDELIEDALIAEKAKEAGLKVTAAEVQETISQDLEQLAAQQSRTQVTATQTATETVPTATPVPQKVLDELYKSALQNIGVTDGQFRAIVQRNLLRTKVQDFLASQVPTTGLVIQVQMIVTDTAQAAIDAQTRVESGEDWATVVAEVSTDTTVKDNGGNMGWVTTGQASRKWGQALEDLLFSLQVGAIGRVESNGKFYVVRVTERQENGPLPEEEVTYRKNNALTDWLEARRASPDVKIEQRVNMPKTGQ